MNTGKLIDKNDQKVFNPVSRLVEEIVNTLQYMKRCGFTGYDPSPGLLEAIEKSPRPLNTGRESLGKIRTDLGDCRRCKLRECRKNIVFGAGNPDARLVFVGEGPGYDEDVQGEPFVGKAGQLLTKIIAAMNLSRNEVYICNVIKCRPPGNRNPEPDEIDACFPFLKRQLSSIAPDLICTLGSVPTRALMQRQVFISSARGRFFEYKGIKVMPTFHPAYLLRNPEKKREVWEDVQKIMAELEKGEGRGWKVEARS